MRCHAAIALLFLLVAGCGDEFSTDPPVIASVDPSASGTSTMMVTDTDTLIAGFTTSSPITGASIRWASSDPARLELRPIAPAGSTRRDSLESETRIQAIALARGSVIVTATVDQPGIQPLSIEDTVTVLERWIAVAAGGGYTCGLTVHQDAYCWGGITSGNLRANFGLGNGSTTGSEIPVPVIGGHKFASISVGDDQTCGLTPPPGLLYCWGRNTWGELGAGTFDDALTPNLAVGGRNFSQISAGAGVTCGVTTSDFMEGEGEPRNTICWGRSSLGELGGGGGLSVSCQDTFFTFLCAPKPQAGVRLPFRGGFALTSVSVGLDFACGLARADEGLFLPGEALCWGLNNFGQLGEAVPPPVSNLSVCSAIWSNNPITVPCGTTPFKASEGLSFTAISAGGQNSCGVSNTKVIYCWGGAFGATPVQIVGPAQMGSISVGGGNNFVGGGSLAGGPNPFVDIDSPLACALTDGGQAYCWGDNVDGELGNGELPPVNDRVRHLDMQMVLQDSLVFVAISAGKRQDLFIRNDLAHACALTRDGAIYCWGNNEKGAVGVPGLSHVAVPTRISEPAP